ncbi:MAG: condensation domain-containing protein, partial [Bacteroidota bacterium]
CRGRTVWVDHLWNKVVPLQLPYDRPRPAIKTLNGAHLPFGLTATEHESLRKLREENKAHSIYTILLGITAILLHRLTGEEHISIGSRSGRRNRPELEHMAGLFVNTILVYAEAKSRYTTGQIIHQVHQYISESIPHQDYPFHKLISRLQRPQDRSRSPLFDVLLDLVNVEDQTSTANTQQLSVTPYPGKHILSKYDLAFRARGEGDQIHLTLEYNTDLFDEATVELFRRQWIEILHQAAQNPSCALEDLVLTEAEIEPEQQAQIVDMFNESF